MPESTVNSLPDSLVPGLKVRLLALETTKSKWETIFIGSKPKRYIVLEQPRVNGLPVKLDDSSKWAINFIHNGQVFNFYCEVIGSCSRPVPLVFLSYPDNVEAANLRNAKRYPVHIPITVEGEADGNSETPRFKGLILDLSMGGCLAATTGELPGEKTLSLTLYLNGRRTIKDLKAEKKSGRRGLGTFYSGLSFLSTNNPEVNNQIAEIINGIENIPLRL
ncbi:MAG: flagellar brake protein [Deltaproteobacteria bacterium]|jgi:c-di-GMP-binding flagellar brake protein YcgR|nr:flagellar brake protein [Deltaproteobacteria bacterium]